MYDLESRVSPNEGCTGSLHTHKNPGWTSKRIRFGDAGIKGRSEDWLPPCPPSAAPGSVPPEPPGGMRRAGTGPGTGTAPLRRTVGGAAGGLPPAPLLRETLRRGRGNAEPRGTVRSLGRPSNALSPPGLRRSAVPLAGLRG